MGKAKEAQAALTLSYSSNQLLQRCERKYFHYKVAHTPIDADAEDSTEAFDIGKAFHQVMELNYHRRTKGIHQDTIDAVKQYKVVDHYYMIAAMVESYLDLHKASGLDCKVCEQVIRSPIYLGYIDALMVDHAKKEYWIVDLKTAGRWEESKLATLPTDEQLNLYSYFMRLAGDTIPEVAGYKLAGCRYRVTTKPKLARKSNENDEAFIKRLAKSAKSIDVVVPITVMCPDTVYARFEDNFQRVKKLHDSRDVSDAKCSFSSCMDWFRPCEYYSQCHGRMFSEQFGHVIAKTAEDYAKEENTNNQETTEGNDDLTDLL